MGTTVVVWREGMRFCSVLDSGEIMCDESSEVGKAYPSSPELLMASLGSCVGSVLVHFAARHGIGLEGMEIALDWRPAEHPYRIGEIDVEVVLPENISDEDRSTLERVAHSCMIHNTLEHPPKISLALSRAS
jgi:putative redox protein